MKIARKTISMVLVLAMSAGLTGCGQKNFSHKTLINAATYAGEGDDGCEAYKKISPTED